MGESGSLQPGLGRGGGSRGQAPTSTTDNPASPIHCRSCPALSQSGGEQGPAAPTSWMTVSGRANPYSIVSTKDGLHLLTVSGANRFGNGKVHTQYRCRNHFIKKSGRCNIELANKSATWQACSPHAWTSAGAPCCSSSCWSSSPPGCCLVSSSASLLSPMGTWSPRRPTAECQHAAGAWPHGAFLFSIETQTTIGYGLRCVTKVAVLMVVVLSIVGGISDSLRIGTIMAKMVQPKKHAQMLLFKYNAVVALHNGKLCLTWCVGT